MLDDNDIAVCHDVNVGTLAFRLLMTHDLQLLIATHHNRKLPTFRNDCIEQQG